MLSSYARESAYIYIYLTHINLPPCSLTHTPFYSAISLLCTSIPKLYCTVTHGKNVSVDNVVSVP